MRWRRGDRVQRQQIKWLAAIVSLGAVVLPMSFIVPTESDEATAVVSGLTVLSLFALPVVIGVAVLRYRLYEIDRIISRTISWTLTTGLVVAMFAAVVIGLQGPLAEVTGGNTLAIAGSTLLAAAVFQPIRRRVQRSADRRFDRGRYDSQQTVDSFADRLRNEIDLVTLRSALVSTADEAVRPATSNVWLRAAPETDR